MLKKFPQKISKNRQEFYRDHFASKKIIFSIKMFFNTKNIFIFDGGFISLLLALVPLIAATVRNQQSSGIALERAQQEAVRLGPWRPVK